MTRKPVSLIFDIGKTTKKVLIFDENFHVLEEQTENFQEIVDDDGFPADDLPSVSGWVIDMFRHYVEHRNFEVISSNFSSYGASLVHLDSKGKSIKPFYNYLKPFPDSTNELFHRLYDPNHDISAVTASPLLGLLNSGLQLFWIKHERPEMFRQIHQTLHLPQYFVQLLSGKSFTDITSVGCHTMLWDFRKKSYHTWVEREQIANLFPTLHPADHTFDLVVGKHKLKMGIGVHDSSAALMPYLVTEKEPFLLLSTGTWNICFNPFNHEPLTTEELRRDCLCYLTYKIDPVKASRIFLGHEHEVQAKSLTKYFKVSDDHYKNVRFDGNIYDQLTAEVDAKPFYPLDMEGTGPLPEKQMKKTDLSVFNNFEDAYHQLIVYLVRWQLISINLIDPEEKVKNIIVVGGFTKNQLFLEILKRQAGSRRVLISDHPRASALGAAWLVADKGVYGANEGLLSVSIA